MICRKAHLHGAESQTTESILQSNEEVAKIIDKELDLLRTSGDIKQNVIFVGSSEDETEEHQDIQGEEICAGYLFSDQKKPCNKKTDKLLNFETKKGPKYFCKGSHLLRYLLLHYCAQGKKTSKAEKRKAVEMELSKEENNTRN